jgi:hypothetical protein
MSKASVKIDIAISGCAESGFSGSYTRAEKNKGNGKSDPEVSSDGDVTVYTNTDITFKITTDGYTFPEGDNAVINIDACDVKPGDTQGHFSIGSTQPKKQGTELELEDDDGDGTSAGKSHEFFLYIVTGGKTYHLDPRFWNRN